MDPRERHHHISVARFKHMDIIDLNYSNRKMQLLDEKFLGSYHELPQ
jgi:hypothetical protein